MFNEKVQYYLGKYKIYNLGIEERGLYEKKLYDHILPEEYKELNFIGNTYNEVLNLENKINFHSITNLKSSQVMCLNLFAPFMNEEYKHILIDVLNKSNVINTKSKIIDFVFEKEYLLEGKTCFDLYLKLEDNTQVFFEIKYTEDGFGKFSNKGNLPNLINKYYKKLFKESLNLNKYDLVNNDNIKFFKNNYQIFRNVGFVKNDKDHCVFLYPFKNYQCMKDINNFCEYNNNLKNIHTLDLEQLVDCILEEVNDNKLINYFKEFKLKYLNYEIKGIDVIDNTDTDYNFKENINNIVINCLDEESLQPKGLYTINKKEHVKSVIDFLFSSYESLHDIDSFSRIIQGNATSRLFIYENHEKDKILEYIESGELRENSLLYVSGDKSNGIAKKINLIKKLILGYSALDTNLVFISMYCIQPNNVYSKLLTEEFGTLDNNKKIIDYIDSGLDDKYFVFNTNESPSVMYSNYKTNHQLDNNSFIIFDIETSGLNKSKEEILKIEAYKITDGIYKDSFSRIVKPKNEVSEFIREITNISEEELNNGIDVDTALKEFFEYINGCILISSNISFDFKLLFNDIEQYNHDIINILMSNTIKIVSLNHFIKVDNCKKDLYSKSQKLLNVISDKWNRSFNKENSLNIQTLNINIFEQRNDLKLYHEFIYNYDEEYLSELRIIDNYKANITLDIIEADISYYKKNELGYSREKIEKILFLHEIVKSMILNNYSYKYKEIIKLKFYNVIYDDMKFKLKNDLTATFISSEKNCNTLKIPSEIKFKNKVYIVNNIDSTNSVVDHKKIILPHTTKTIKCLNFCNVEELIIGKNVSRIDALYLPYLQTIVVHKDNKLFSSLDGVLYNKDFTKLIHYPSKRKNDSFTLLDSVVHIDEKIESPNLINLHIGISFVYKYDEWISLDLKYLENISVSKSNMYLMSYDGVLYTKNMDRLILYPNNKKDKVYNIPDSVNYIESFALWNYNLEQLVLSETLDIDYNAIGCYNLNSIVIKEKNDLIDKTKLSITKQNIILIDEVLYKKDNLSILATCNNNYIKIIDGVEYIEQIIYTKKLELPITVKEIDSHMLDVEEIIVTDDNKYYCLIDEVLYSKDKRTLVYYPYTKKDKVFVVPEFVERIECKFTNDNLEELVILNNVSECSIYNLCYIGERIKKITLPIKFKDKVLEYPEISEIETIYIY